VKNARGLVPGAPCGGCAGLGELHARSGHPRVVLDEEFSGALSDPGGVGRSDRDDPRILQQHLPDHQRRAVLTADYLEVGSWLDETPLVVPRDLGRGLPR